MMRCVGGDSLLRRKMNDSLKKARVISSNDCDANTDCRISQLVVFEVWFWVRLTCEAV